MKSSDEAPGAAPLPFGMVTSSAGVIFSSWDEQDLCPTQRDLTPEDLRALGWVPSEEACVDVANALADQRDAIAEALEALVAAASPLVSWSELWSACDRAREVLAAQCSDPRSVKVEPVKAGSEK